ncbi:unnamed protein product [Soboliphyme baturini]|uniref:Uncharacterized protein n=1 Tax=Soboliphyme baturini TaxID=241478 RepID=A0A183IBK4_9BILA|nr:unnamed protein product [Soboliphyme baturini]
MLPASRFYGAQTYLPPLQRKFLSDFIRNDDSLSRATSKRKNCKENMEKQKLSHVSTPNKNSAEQRKMTKRSTVRRRLGRSAKPVTGKINNSVTYSKSMNIEKPTNTVGDGRDFGTDISNEAAKPIVTAVIAGDQSDYGISSDEGNF